MPHPTPSSLLLHAMGRLIDTTFAGASVLFPFPRLITAQSDQIPATGPASDAAKDSPEVALHSARVCAAQRALETERPDALFRDPFAALLAGPDELAGARQRHAKRGAATTTARIAIRTRLFDDWICATVSAANARPVTQVVLLAAGLDMRASRLAGLRDARVFEIDLPPVLACKAAALRDARASPRVLAAALARVPVDVTADWSLALLAAGFDARRPALWVAEGLLYYLTPHDVDQLLLRVRRLSAPGSRLLLSAVTGARALGADGGKAGGLVASFRSAMPDPCATLGRLGFEVERVVALGEPDARYGRCSEKDVRSVGAWEGRRSTIYVSATFGGAARLGAGGLG